ncbi:MAG: hypothetical protein HQ541_02140 [Mariniphaga sp.]|nr:hypothetical protein [Mariniphaga sp.]
MADINFPEILKTLKEEVTSLALTTAEKYKNEAKADALKLVDDLKENLEKWTLLLAEGKLSKKDFEFLVLGQKELIEMNAIKQAGLALIKADEFKNTLLKKIINTVIDLI